MSEALVRGEARIGGVILDRGMPKICEPVMEKTILEIEQAAERAKQAQADLIELRIAGECMGSCRTFGAAGEASVPGQRDARRLRDALNVVHDALGMKSTAY